jgi:hypothetical protein
MDEENPDDTEEHDIEHHRDDMDDDGENDQLIHSKPKINGLLPRGQSGYIGGGWKLAWKTPSEYCLDREMDGVMERLYIHEEGVPIYENGSSIDVPLGGNLIKATALVNKSVFHKNQTGNHIIDLCSHEKDFKSTKWSDLLEPGVKRALVLGIGIQILQQV